MQAEQRDSSASIQSYWGAFANNRIQSTDSQPILPSVVLEKEAELSVPHPPPHTGPSS
jgi:hypothetical protein